MVRSTKGQSYEYIIPDIINKHFTIEEKNKAERNNFLWSYPIYEFLFLLNLIYEI